MASPHRLSPARLATRRSVEPPVEASPSTGPLPSGTARTDGSAAPSASGRPRPSWATIGIFLLLLVAGLAYAKAFLTPILLAVLLTLVFSPLRRALGRLGLPDGCSAALLVGGLAAVLMSVGWLLSAPLSEWMADASQIGERLEERIHELRSAVADEADGESLSETLEGVKEAAAPGSAERPTVVLAGEGPMERLIALVPGLVVQTVLVLVLLLFLLASGDMFYEKIVHVTPRFRDKRRAVEIAHGIERKLSRYLLTITAVNAALGTAIGLTMWALGMPDPLLFGVIGWLLNYVPYIGALAGSALALVVGLLSFDTLWPALLPGLLYYALTAIEGQFVTPCLVGRELKLNTVVVFVTIAFWAWLWSIVGMLIAVPVLVAIRVICRAVPSLKPVADFLSARGAERDGPPREAVGLARRAPRPGPGTDRSSAAPAVPDLVGEPPG